MWSGSRVVRLPSARRGLIHGALTELLIRVDRDLDAPVLGPARLGVVRRDGLILAPSAGLDALVHALIADVASGRLRATDREIFVVFAAPDRVGVSDDEEVAVLVLCLLYTSDAADE